MKSIAISKLFTGFVMPLSLAISALITGCAVGPDYKRPKDEVEQNFGELYKTTQTDPAAQSSKAISETPQISEWWRTFHDPELDARDARPL